MSNFNYYKADKAYGELYLQFPLVLMYGDKYSKLSDSAKIAYMVFKNRLQYSIKNNWIDTESNLYFIFTNEELMTLLNKSENTVTKIRKELVTAGLLFIKKNGFDPIKKKNRPDHLYLADLEVEATDVYLLQNQIETLSNQGTAKNEARYTSGEMPVNQGTAKNEARSKVVESQSNQGTAKNEVNLYITKSSKDIKDIKESEKNDKCDTNLIAHAFESKEKELELQLMNDYIQENSYEFIYGKELLNKFKAYSFNDFDTFVMFTSKLVYAHDSVEKETNITLSIHENTQYSDFTRGQLVKTFNRCIKAQRFNKANNIANYLFVSFKNVFKDLAETVINAKTQPEGKINVPIEF